MKFDTNRNASPLKISYLNTRLPSLPSSSNVTCLKESDDCEVLTEGKNDDEPSGWWPATVKMIKGEFFVVDYKIQDDDTKYSDIIPSDRIRTPNNK